MGKYVIGVDFGTESGRAVVIAPDDATKYLAAYAPYL